MKNSTLSARNSLVLLALFASVIALLSLPLHSQPRYSWKRMGGIGNKHISAMAADRYGAIYAGSLSLKKSVDEGEHWVTIDDESSPYRYRDLNIIDSILFADLNHADCDVIFGTTQWSTNLGKSWANDSLTYAKGAVYYDQAIVVNGVIYKRSDRSLIASSDGGKSWKTLDSTAGDYIRYISKDARGNIIYQYDYQPEKLKKYTVATGQIHDLYFDQFKSRGYGLRSFVTDSANNYYVGFYSSPTDYILMSKDEGKSWSPIGLGFPVSDMITPPDGSVFVATEKNGTYYTLDHGATWTKTPEHESYYDTFLLSSAGSLFVYGASLYKFENNKWIEKNADFDDQSIFKIEEYNGQVYCSGSGYESSGNGLYILNKTTDSWESYFIDTLDENNEIVNFVFASDTIVAVNGTNTLSLSPINSPKWTASTPKKMYNAFCYNPFRYMLDAHERSVWFANRSSSSVYSSHDAGDTWTQHTPQSDSTRIEEMLVDSNGTVFLETYNRSYTSDSIIYSTDSARTWRVMTPLPERHGRRFLTLDINNNVLLIDSNTFYRANRASGIWDKVFTSPIGYNPSVVFIDSARYCTIAYTNYGPATDKVIIVDLLHTTIDTIGISYPYIDINRIFRTHDGKVYAATDRGVFKLEERPVTVREGEISAPLRSLYPNPAGDAVTLPADTPPHGAITISTILGVPVVEMQYQSTVNVSALAPGVYYLRTGDRVYPFVKY